MSGAQGEAKWVCKILGRTPPALTTSSRSFLSSFSNSPVLPGIARKLNRDRQVIKSSAAELRQAEKGRHPGRRRASECSPPAPDFALSALSDLQVVDDFFDALRIARQLFGLGL